jgi:hypothetical protein
MEFRIADTFTDSLARLTAQEQKAAKTTAFDLQINLNTSGNRFHKLERLKDPNFWSVSVNMDIRIIVHRSNNSILLCYIDHHDQAYAWATRRKLERHPNTGAAQLVEIRETIEQISTTTVKVKPTKGPLLFSKISPEELLNYGIPSEWLEQVQQANEDNLFEIIEHLPQEAAEALLELAVGGKPQKPNLLPESTNPFEHPDAQRRFRVMANITELERALDYPWQKWTVFLHPSQRTLVEKDYSGPARVSGSAGTGKTIVGLHRAVFLAKKYPQSEILLTTFSQALANSLKYKLKQLVGNELGIFKQIKVTTIQQLALELYIKIFGEPKIVDSQELIAKLVSQNPRFSTAFLAREWSDVVDAWQIKSPDAYKDVPRLGRKTRIGNKQRQQLWEIFQNVLIWLEQTQQITWSQIYYQITDYLVTQGDGYPLEFAVVDEAQDIGIPELRFLAPIAQLHPDSLFFTGDLGQRIFQQPFSWKSLGVDIRGRSQTLNINYRTSHQIRAQADRLLPNSINDVDGNQEQRASTISVFNGPVPTITTYKSELSEIQAIAQWLKEQLESGIQPEEIGVFVREQFQIERAKAAIQQTGYPWIELDSLVEPEQGSLTVSTMHLAKGLEFRAVVVMACDDEVIPLQERIESAADESELEEVYSTERHLLYVACTRARDYLLVTGVIPASEFLDDLMP